MLTGFADIFAQFLASAERCEPAVRKIVVTSHGLDLSHLIDGPLHGWTIVQGAEPFVFARNANLGIQAAGADDVLLLNDDVSFTRPNTVRDLRHYAYQNDRLGMLSPQFLGRVGNYYQRSTTPLRDDVVCVKERLCFTGVYMKRAMLDAVGPLDERFTGYGAEDDDYCLRARRAGFLLGVTPCVVMRHGFAGRTLATTSFARTMANVDRSANEMAEMFRQKWAGVTEGEKEEEEAAWMK